MPDDVVGEVVDHPGVVAPAHRLEAVTDEADVRMLVSHAGTSCRGGGSPAF
jgi:hypothetical protein